MSKKEREKGPKEARESWKGATVDKNVARMLDEPPPPPKKEDRSRKKD